MPAIAEWMVSGGVGQLMLEERPASVSEAAVYGDIGPILAHRLAEVCRQMGVRIAAAEQTVRATVIGAGMESTEISGSTVFIDASRLPLRNLPVCKIELPHSGSSDAIAAAIRHGVSEGSRLFGKEGSPPFAIALGNLGSCSFSTLQLIASELASQYRLHCADTALLVVITVNDYAKALGQALTLRCQGNPRVICIDQIDVEQWDYVDLGEPIANSMIPVMIKTLAFHNA
jgi:ethanolamine utilization protein EutA